MLRQFNLALGCCAQNIQVPFVVTELLALLHCVTSVWVPFTMLKLTLETKHRQEYKAVIYLLTQATHIWDLWCTRLSRSALAAQRTQ